MKLSARWPLYFAVFLILAGISLRVARHLGIIDLPPNVAPVSALAMFSAVYLPRRFALAVPLTLMMLSDALIGWYEPLVMVSVYLSFGISLLLGWWLRKRFSAGKLVTASLTGSVGFFLITNAAVWLFGHGYPPGLPGLLQAYSAGLPFFRNSVFGDLGYVALFFGLYQAVVVYSQRLVPLFSRAKNGRI